MRRLQPYQGCRIEPRLIFPLWPVFARLYSGLALFKHASSHDMNEGSEDEFGSPGLLSTDSSIFLAALSGAMIRMSSLGLCICVPLLGARLNILDLRYRIINTKFHFF